MENTASAMASMEKLDHSNQAFPVSEFIDEHTDVYFIYSMDNFVEDKNLVFLK